MPKSQYHPHARAAIDFSGSRFAHIYLSPEADSSSLVHEGGHLFLEMYTDAAGRKGATPALLADYGIMLDWFGLSDAQWRAMPLSDREPYHELFAEAFTLYVATRHSPAEGAHRAFGDWLSAAHLELQPHRPTPPGASILALFDRLTMVTSPEWPLEAGAGVAETIQKAAEEAGLSPWVARTQGALYGSAFQRLYENQRESLETFLGRYQLSVSSASGALPVMKTPTMLYQIAGRHSETASLDLLDLARERLAAADQPERAFRETGWYLGIDGQWRYEISDHLVQPLAPFDQPELPFGEGYARVQAARLAGGALGVRLKDVIRHDVLFEAYPELAGVSVTVIPGRSSHFKVASSVDPAAFHIGSSLSSSEGIDSLLHEVQHWIQTFERFTPGSSFEREREDYERSEKHFNELIGRLRGLEASIKGEALIKVETDPLWRAQALAWAQQQPGIRTLSTQGQAIVYEQHQNPEYSKLFSEYMAQVSGPFPLTPIDRYRRAAGEVEARNTVSRRAMDAAQRRDMPPWLTQDTPDTEQLVTQQAMPSRVDNHTGASPRLVSETETETPTFQRRFKNSKLEEVPDLTFLHDLLPAGGMDSLSNNDIVNIIATAHSHGDRTLYATMKKLYLSAPRVREVAKQEFSYLSPFFTDSDYAPLASMASNASDRLGAKSLQAALLEERGGDLTGLVLENRSGDRWALFLPDASEPGRYRYSEFSPNGPMSHSTRNSYVELLAEAIDAGYRQPVDPQVLEDITHTPAFEHGAAISILIDQLNYGHISHDEYIEQTAKLSPVPDDTPQIASPDFQRRFTGSQVVDSSGNPLLVYHGTNAVFEDFQIGRSGGIYFTSNIHYASSYGRNIMPAYVNLKNPLDVVHNKAHRELAIDLFNNMGGWEDNEDVMSERESPFYDPAMDSLWEILDDPDVSDEIRALGYDGFIGDEASPEDPPIVSYVAFSPEQITVANDSLVRQQVRASLTGDSAEQATVKSAFNRWLGASKAIDEDTGNPIKLIIAPDQGSSDSLAGQLLHAQDGYSRRIADPLHPTVKADASVYLRATNPYITDALNELDEHAMSDLKDDLLAQGYDAIVTPDRRTWVALESNTQIKSAIANTGEYSLHDTDIRFRLGDVIMHAADPVRYRQAETLLSNLTRRWPPEALDRVTLVDRFEDLDPRTRKAILTLGGNPFTRGCALDGHCYIIARNHTNLLDLESTLFHEAYGHLGFSALFGSKLTRKMADLHSAVGGDEGLIELSRRYGINLTAAGERFAALVDSGDITQDQRNAYMMEELLAHMQEDQRPTLARRAKETWGMIRSWFRANSSHLARATDADLFYTLKCARNAFVELGKDQHARGSSTSPGMLNGSATWYRSALADTIPAMATIADKDGKVFSDQALAWLRSQQKRGAFRKDELTWSGLEEWLLLNDGKVLVDDVQGYINNNAIKVNTVTYGNAFHHLQKVCNEAGYEIETTAEEVVFLDNDGDICEFDDLPDNIKQAINNDDTPRANARYPQYQTLPSHRYREVLITLDDTCLTTGSFEHAHWDVPNVLAHVRLAETEKDGRRTLFVEEIQSDWGQTAQAFGLRGEAIQYGTKVHGYTPEGYHWQKDVRPDVSYVVHQLVNTKNGEVVAEGSDRIEALLKSGLEKTQPSAPFIDATEKWVTLALKRVIAIAADEGFDEVALVNGDQCARTLSVSKHLSRIDIERMATDNQSYQMDAYDNSGTQVISNQVIDQNILADYLGKNLAQTIASQKEGKHSYTDLDMMIGGNGLKTFYDKIVPSVLSRLLKKLGGPDMTSRPVVPGDSSENIRFDITDSLRRQASHGLPLLRAADRYPVSSLSDVDLSDVELLNSDPHHQHRVQMS